MKSAGVKTQNLKEDICREEPRDVLGLSMLSLTGFQIYHICDKKLFPYSLITQGKFSKSNLR
jgi:hypothetical protein